MNCFTRFTSPFWKQAYCIGVVVTVPVRPTHNAVPPPVDVSETVVFSFGSFRPPDPVYADVRLVSGAAVKLAASRLWVEREIESSVTATLPATARRIILASIEKPACA